MCSHDVTKSFKRRLLTRAKVGGYLGSALIRQPMNSIGVQVQAHRHLALKIAKLLLIYGNVATDNTTSPDVVTSEFCNSMEHDCTRKMFHNSGVFKGGQTSDL